MKFLSGLLFALFILGLIIGVRTANFESRQMQVLDSPVPPFGKAELAKKLSAGIQVKTVSVRSPDPKTNATMQAFRRLLAKQFPTLFQKLEISVIGESLVLYWAGNQQTFSPFLLLAHADVVPAKVHREKSWLHPPFSGVIDQNQVWGRGALDNKGQLYQLAAALEAHAKEDFRPKRDWWIVFGQDEEVGGQYGNKQVAQYFARKNIRFEAVFDEGGAVVSDAMPGFTQPIAFVGIAEKGYLTLKLQINGRSGHSSTPTQESAIAVLAKAITRLEASPAKFQISEPVAKLFDFLGPEMQLPNKIATANRWLFEPLLIYRLSRRDRSRAMLHTTLVPTIIQGGIQENVLPRSVTATINLRLTTTESSEAAIARVRQVIDDPRIDIHVEQFLIAEPSPVSDVESNAFRRLQETIHQTFPDALVTPYMLMAATDSRHYAALTENIFRFTPYAVSSAELDTIHGVNERIAIDNLTTGAAFYYRLIGNLDR